MRPSTGLLWLALGLALGCSGADEVEVAEPVVAAEPEPEPAAEVVEPEPAEATEVAATKVPATRSEPVTRTTSTKPKPKPKPAPVAPALAHVTIAGDAKDVWLLPDSVGSQRSNGGPTEPGAYKVKAWFKSPVPVIAGNISLAPGEKVIVQCTASKQRCEKQQAR